MWGSSSHHPLPPREEWVCPSGHTRRGTFALAASACDALLHASPRFDSVVKAVYRVYVQCQQRLLGKLFGQLEAVEQGSFCLFLDGARYPQYNCVVAYLLTRDLHHTALEVFILGPCSFFLLGRPRIPTVFDFH